MGSFGAGTIAASKHGWYAAGKLEPGMKERIDRHKDGSVKAKGHVTVVIKASDVMIAVD